MPSLQSTMENLMRRHIQDTSPGAVLLLAREGETVFLEAAGLADLGQKTTLTPHSTFRLASVSKQFTAMGVLLLAQQGMVNLQDQLSLFIPELAHFKGVQLQHLLNHTSGLPDFEEFIPEHQARQLRDEDVLRLTAAQKTAFFAAGSMYRYSNTAYVLLGLLVERVSGIEYGEFLQKRMFEPLQMQNSILYSATATIPHRALGYRRDETGHFILSDQTIGTATRGDGCIYTSAPDYLKWLTALEVSSLFNINDQLEKYSSSIDPAKGWRYSMGWFMSEVGNGQLEYCHSGDTSGFTNLVIRLPRHKSQIICFSNIANNQLFLSDLLQELQQFPAFCPESELVQHLQELTR
ncbi:serine hydrolase domain-containing protein [Pontibacter mangrovi]|uniref:Beta-lactamase family protein n=1 Tax=Pontibacter mangrovi TaxID=2589816 RepID=A0A501WKX5_9BACT|nr:serine hydrolase domain-containing protein [Pontibacter mangrovi]TPE46296.1 beta-lactamase family protein [Pontibacter mangrovi]